MLLSIAAALLMLILPVNSLVSQSANAAPDPLSKPDAFRVDNLATSAHGLSFSLKSGKVQVDQRGQLSADGLEFKTLTPDQPALPFFSTYIILPPNADVEASVSQPVWQDSGDYDWSPDYTLEFPGATLPGDIDLPAVGEELSIDTERQYRAEDGYFPEKLFDLSDPMYVRDIRLAKLSIYPVRYNAYQGRTITAGDIAVEVRFTGVSQETMNPLPSVGDHHAEALAPLTINWEQGKAWRSRPEFESSDLKSLPLGIDVYKIAVDSDNIYRIDYGDLWDAGMEVDSVDPRTFEMLYRGETVAYKFVGNDDAEFQDGEYLLFYGWEFDGPRLEKQFITENYFWLWAGGIPTQLEEIDSVPGTLVDVFTSTVTLEPENVWFPTWTDAWDEFPNEPDAWYWERYTKSSAAPVTKTYEIELPYPAATGYEAILIAELSSKFNPTPGGVPTPHVIHASINSSERGTTAWYGKRNVNVLSTIPITGLSNGTNSVDIVVATESPLGTNTAVYLNRITVEYTRQFTATGDRLDFNSAISGSKEFSIKGISTGSPSDIQIWDITERLNPRKVKNETIDITGSGPYTFSFGSERNSYTEFIATAMANVSAVKDIEQLTLEDIDPPSPGADWIAIIDKSFLTETQRLADHRSTLIYGGMLTHIIDVQSVINQYEYGLPLPSAIKGYLTHAFDTWQVAPSYLTLIGDSTNNPHNNLHLGGQFFAPQVVPTDLAFVDRFQGQIPSDHIYSLISGADLIPDIAVGRIPAKTSEELSNVVDKIVWFESNQLLPAGWMENILFLADEFDSSAGNFCLENVIAAAHIPDALNKEHLCLPIGATDADAELMRSQFFTMTNLTGVTLVNYRGHGGPDFWAGNPTILSNDHLGLFTNNSKPIIIVTGDCLDGMFTIPNRESLAETYIRAGNGGSAAHWSSSGLGYSNEHSVMVDNFYDGLFPAGQTAIGDAVNFAKYEYELAGGHESLMYSFILEGDPAMQTMRPAISLQKSTPSSNKDVGELIDFHIRVANSGIYPSHVIVQDTLPAGTTMVTASASVDFNMSTSGSSLLFDLQFDQMERNVGIPRNEAVAVTLTARIEPHTLPGQYTNYASADLAGEEAWPGDESDSASFSVWGKNLLPVLQK